MYQLEEGYLRVLMRLEVDNLFLHLHILVR
jgi:hypothetical protein